jgi:hypothetical protein
MRNYYMMFDLKMVKHVQPERPEAIVKTYCLFSSTSAIGQRELSIRTVECFRAFSTSTHIKETIHNHKSIAFFYSPNNCYFNGIVQRMIDRNKRSSVASALGTKKVSLMSLL